MGLEAQVLKRIVPSPSEEARLWSTVDEVLARVAARVRAHGIEAEPLLVGSVAKGTHLSNAEIDVFVLFPRQTTREVLERVGLDLGAFLKDKVRMYAEHPFTRGRWSGVEVEVVPCYRISDASQRMSAVDRTPLHARYVIEKLAPGQRDEVRLLKAFCEGVGVYGAEAKVQGLSGYLCELFVLKYGTFEGVLKAASGWRREQVLQLDTAPAKSFAEPLVFVDPVDGERNVASAVGEESLATFVHAARSFLVKRRLEFFFPRPRKPFTAAQARTALRRRGTTLLGVAFTAPKITDDVLYPQIRKAQRAIEDLCRRAGFRIATSRASVVDGSVLLLMEFEVFALPAAEKHRGPPIWVPNAEDFLRRWRGSQSAMGPTHLEGDRWVVDIRRNALDAAALIEENMPRMSLGSHLGPGARRARLLRDAQLFAKSFLAEVTRVFDPRFPWD